jgi:hypothetical protein
MKSARARTPSRQPAGRRRYLYQVDGRDARRSILYGQVLGLAAELGGPPAGSHQ